MNLGWECPKCGAVMSPYYPTCWYCHKGNTLTNGIKFTPIDPTDTTGVKP